MKKLLALLLILLSISIAEASVASININWQLSSSVVRPSSVATILLTISNPGIELTNVVIKATPGPYITLTGGDKIELGALPSAASSQIAFSIKIDDNALSTSSYVYLKAQYYASSSSYEKDLYIPITIIRDPILEIVNVKFNDTVEPGKTFLLSFDISNKGDSAAKDLKIRLNKTSLFTTPDSAGEFVLSELRPLESISLKFLITLSPGAEVGIESIPLILSYFDDIKTNNYTEAKSIGLKITGSIDFVVTVNSYNNFFYGRSGEVSISIANRGSSPAEYLSARAYSDFGSKEFYIGSLDADDSETIELPQDLSRASDKYPVYVKLDYKDKFENEYSVEKTLEVVPSNAPIDYNIVFIISAVVLVIVYWLYRKRKK